MSSFRVSDQIKKKSSEQASEIPSINGGNRVLCLFTLSLKTSEKLSHGGSFLVYIPVLSSAFIHLSNHNEYFFQFPKNLSFTISFSTLLLFLKLSPENFIRDQILIPDDEITCFFKYSDSDFENI